MRSTTVRIPRMDCPSDEQLVRLALAGLPEIVDVEFALAARTATVRHTGDGDRLLAAIARTGLGAELLDSAVVEPATSHRPEASAERRVLWAVLVINAAMFVVELTAGLRGQSAGLLADSADMLADATIYGIALAAVGGALAAQRRAARISGWFQSVFAVLVLADVVRRAVQGSEPASGVMMAVGALALAANATSVVLVGRHRGGGMHLRASWIFSVNDTLANAAVIVAGMLVAATGSAWPDLVVGTAVALLVASGAVRILRMTGRSVAGH